MIKNWFTLFLCLSISNTALALGNVLCQNMNTDNTECAKIAKKMYESRMDRIANAYIKTTREKKGNIVEKNDAKSRAKKLQSLNEFMESFRTCGEQSPTYEKAELCLDSAYMTAAKKREQRILNSQKQQNSTANTQFKTTPLSQKFKEYILKTYKPSTKKKIVLYLNETPNCPYGKAFMKAFNKQKSRKDLQQNYFFKPLTINLEKSLSIQNTNAAAEKAVAESELMVNFLSNCGIFCIVNIENNWLYSIGNSVGQEETDILPTLFTSLQSK